MSLLVGGKLMVLRNVSFQALDREDHGDPLMLGLHSLCVLRWGARGCFLHFLLFLAVSGLLIAVTSLGAEHRL